MLSSCKWTLSAGESEINLLLLLCFRPYRQQNHPNVPTRNEGIFLKECACKEMTGGSQLVAGWLVAQLLSCGLFSQGLCTCRCFLLGPPVPPIGSTSSATVIPAFSDMSSKTAGSFLACWQVKPPHWELDVKQLQVDSICRRE